MTQQVSYWDRLPLEIQDIVLTFAGPLTLFVCGRHPLQISCINHADERELQRAVWRDAFMMDWHGPLSVLPPVELQVDDVVLIKSRRLYDMVRLAVGGHRSLSQTYIQDIPIRHMWLDLVPMHRPVDLALRCIENGHARMLRYLVHERNVRLRDVERVMRRVPVDVAAENGHLDVVQVVHELNGEMITTRTMDAAARSGHLHIVKWLHDNRSEGCTTSAMDEAAWTGRLDIVKWLHENRSEGCTSLAMDFAARSGHVDVVKWLCMHRPEMDIVSALQSAEDAGQTEIAEWLREQMRSQPHDQ